MSLFMRTLTLMLLILSKAPAYAAIPQEAGQEQEEFREAKGQTNPKRFKHSLSGLYSIEPVSYPVIQPHDDFDALYARAVDAQSELEAICSNVALLTNTQPLFSGVKSKQRALEKVNGELNGQAGQITDLARASIIADDIESLVGAYESLEREAQVIQVKNRFKTPKASGYRDLNLLVRLPHSGLIAEVQLHLRAIAEVKSGPEHDLYEIIQSVERKAIKEQRKLTDFETAQITSLQRQSTQLYQQAWQPYLTTQVKAA
jgi:ppGpp synthetase/RelA/SpoT-type nucleotidyltranferase